MKYITTPIYYVNDIPHIGHAYTTIAADVLARYWRTQNDEVFFLTGSDEHGAKIAEAACKAGKEPKEFVDELAPKFQQAWQKLNISNDQFFRTTNPEHAKVVQEFVKRLSDAGYVEKKQYEGLYCTGCERFYQPDEAVDGKCPDHDRLLEKKSEENYFFLLSKFGERLLEIIEKGEMVIAPESRKNEVVGKIKTGLEDVSISRGEVSWGIPYPGDEKQTIYVWVDALINYYSAVVINQDKSEKLKVKSDGKNHLSEDSSNTESYKPQRGPSIPGLTANSTPTWPADLHLMAKDILWFHAVIWPAMLMAIGEKPPRKVYAHGFFTIGGRKMSKSLGNTLDPVALAEKYGSDTVRYCLLREFPFGEDGDISEEKIAARYQSDLANGLGNLLNRTLSMIKKYHLDSTIRAIKIEDVGFKIEYNEATKSAEDLFEVYINELNFNEYLSDIWHMLIKPSNELIDREKPWELFKNNETEKLEKLISRCYKTLVQVNNLISPFVPETAEKMKKQLETLEPEPLFPRLGKG